MTGKYYTLLIIILIGFAIRIYALNDLTMTPDDRNVINGFLEIPFRDVFTITTQHGFPEHTFANLLIWWANKLGWQLFILRWPGVWFGVLTLAVTYRIIQKMLDASYGLAVTFLLALSQRHTYFSHQIRGYSEMIFFAVASFYFLWRAMETRRWRDWFFFAITSALGIYNHFFFATLLATQGTIVAIWLVVRMWQQRPKIIPFLRNQVVPPLVAGVSSVVMAAVLFVPLLPQFFKNFVAADSDFTLSTASLAETLLPYFNLLKDYSGTVPPWSFSIFLGLSLVGTVLLLRLKPKLAGILIGWLIIPLLIVALAQVYISWFYARDRYLIFTLPAFITLVGIGWFGLVRITGKIRPIFGTTVFGLSLVGMLITSNITLSNYFETTATGNWYKVSSFLTKNALPDDMILCEPFGHGWKAVDLPATDECTYSLTYQIGKQTDIIYPIVNLPAVATYNTFLENPILLQRNPRIWVVVWNIPDSWDNRGVSSQAVFSQFRRTIILGPVQAENTIASLIQLLQQINTLSEDPSTKFALLTRLADLYAALGETDPAAKILTQAKQIMPNDDRARSQVSTIEQHLLLTPLTIKPGHELSTELGDQIRLTGYSLMPETVVRGQSFQLTLFWQALVRIHTDYAVFLHLRNEANQTVAQFDFSPDRPTSGWWAGDVLHDTLELQLPPELSPGRYRLLVGIYRTDSLQRLAVQNDDTGENAIEVTVLELR
jgi:hypothetical protein